MSDLAMLQLREGYLAFAQDWSAQIAKNVLTGAEVADYVTDKSGFQASFKIDQELRPPEGYEPDRVYRRA